MIGLFLGKLLQSLIGTTKTICIQKNKILATMLMIFIGNIIYLLVIVKIVKLNDTKSILIFATASCIGTFISMQIGRKLSKDKLYFHYCLVNNKEEILEMANLLEKEGIKYVIPKLKDKFGNEILGITVYAETKAESKFVTKLTYTIDGVQRYLRHGVN